MCGSQESYLYIHSIHHHLILVCMHSMLCVDRSLYLGLFQVTECVLYHFREVVGQVTMGHSYREGDEKPTKVHMWQRQTCEYGYNTVRELDKKG